MTWATDRRLDYIDRCLAVYGEITRECLVEAFGISPSQASMDFYAFRKAHPRRMRFDRKRKAYVPVKDERSPVRDIMIDSAGRLVITLEDRRGYTAD